MNITHLLKKEHIHRSLAQNSPYSAQHISPHPPPPPLILPHLYGGKKKDPNAGEVSPSLIVKMQTKGKRLKAGVWKAGS